TVRKMASETDHLTRTASNVREKVVANAEIKKIDSLSSTVKRLHLYVENKDFSFKAGQWVDMFIPGLDTVGGFSMCSSPDFLIRTRILQLAVKASPHPPAHWVHTQCQVGDTVKLRVGGDFYYDPQPHTKDHDLLLIAGGVGINPLFSILQHFLFLHSGQVEADVGSRFSQDKSVSLLYSARNAEELIFQTELIEMTEKYDNLLLKMFSTQGAVEHCKYITEGRIQLKDVKNAVSALDREKTMVYICGPLPFIEKMKSYCLDCDISEDRVNFEKWW
ncbi:unnamed protein product, partial [Candidula unifasciata]